MVKRSSVGVLGTAVAVALGVLVAGATAGWAGNLKDVIKNLYGGDGIRLQPPPPSGSGGTGGGSGSGTGGGGGFGSSHDPHFTVASLQQLDTLGQSLAAGLGTFSFGSTVAAFTFDVERGVPVRTTDSLGPLLAERAATLGEGKLNLAASYTRLEFKRLQGKRLDRLKLEFLHEDSNNDGTLGTPQFELDIVEVALDLTIEEDILALFATYGLTKHWDVGIVVPIVHIRLRAEADASIIRRSAISTTVHNFGSSSDPTHSSGGGEETGFGDVLVRTKYNFLRNTALGPDLAVVGQVKLPTGNEDDLLGTGETNFLGLLVASKALGWLTPHVNLGYEASTDSELNNVRYVAGVDARLHPRAAVALDVLGRWEHHRSGNGAHLVDLAVGAKWNPFGSFVVGANVQVPLNRNEGLRPDFVWTIAAEYTF